MFCWGTQVKGCLAKADTGETVFEYSRHVKGHLMKEYKYDPRDCGRQALSIGLVCSASLFFANNSNGLTGSPYIALLSSTCGNAAIEKLAKNFL